MSDFTNTFRVFFPSSFRASGLVAALAFFVCLTAAPSALALNYTVTTVADSGAGSLRQAVLDANGTAADDVIDFNIPAVSCPGGVCTITLASDISITDNGSLTINGTGARSLIIDGGAGTNRIFYSNAATFNLSGVTLTGGNGTGSALVFNGNGGAIFVNRGTTTISGVYVNANTAALDGGGIHFSSGTNHRVENSTFSGNTVNKNGGGISVDSASLTVVNTTLTGNSANSSAGGGIVVTGSGTLTLRGNTITANTAFLGGGIYQDSGTLDFGNTIIAGNTGKAFPEIFLNSGTATSRGFNLVGDSANDSTETNTAIIYQSTDILDTPPLLGALTIDNGGTTPTHALMTGSPAIDKGISFGLTTDQRGLTRPVDNTSITNATGGDGADIGAFEVQLAPTAATVSVSGRVTTASGRGISNVRLTLTDSNGEVRTTKTTSFGYYRFADVRAGETYFLSAIGKRFSFSQPTQVLNINEETDAINFIADSK
ncbi:MAG: carboxypeptidase regulatory-like domain-containing protein [Acidobacteriota bacterium]|nr:carboxypeptidase regulatory-like domain-containing protein [Acidobacteriota bacterium]